MSDMDENADKLSELTNKLNRCNKNIKTIMENSLNLKRRRRRMLRKGEINTVKRSR